ncbi:MAG: DNA polymerase III subunit alpha [Patescibacteria group bacterium]
MYIPLHTHSHYSLLDGLSQISALVNKAKDCGMPALALTDHGVIYGAIEFYQKCKTAGIKPIIGVEAYIVDNRHKKEAAGEERFHLILLAKNYNGYMNLIQLTSLAHLEGFYYKPRIDWEILQKYGNDLIGLSACLAGEIPRAIEKGWSDEKIEALIKKYQAVFGEKNFFLEVQHHPGIPRQAEVNERIFYFGKKMNIPIVATNDSHYTNPEDAEAQDVLLCLQTKKTINDTDRMSYIGVDLSLLTPEQMANNFRDNPEVLQNTLKIADMCDVEIPLGKIQLPYYEVPEGMTDFEMVKKLCFDNINERYGFDPFREEFPDKEKVIVDRVNYELSVIEKTGYSSYFLIVQDFINWAKNNGVVVGPGRGSAAGSVVAYLLKITNIDPLKYDLLFERFLNPDRISMPDIDTDFADERREDVLRYVEEKYGKDHVSQIITFGTMAARAAVKDVGRVLGVPYGFCDQISKLIPMGLELDEALSDVAELKQLYESNDEAKRLIDFAKKLEGVARHASTHACGVVITREPLTHYCPVQFARDKEGVVVSQYSLHPVEDLGLLKMDFLGLKNLTIIERACEIIKKIHGIEINVDKLPLDDYKSYEVFQRGMTTGVFQFESSGMKRYLKQLQPSVFEDLIAMVALYRPGPLNSGMVDEFIARKHGLKEITYLHPLMESALKNTYGVIVYQEQVMQLSKDMAGFTGGQADTLRKAMGKKNAELMEKMKKIFLEGCAKNNISEHIANETFVSMEKFAEYGFNKSHAACYAFIAYITAYLKANYPAEFMASLLTCDQHDMDRIAIEIDECKQMGLEILPPDVNESFSTFTVVAESLKEKKPRIRFGLNAIRNVGENVAKELIHERKEKGLFQSLEDFLCRQGALILNKKSLEGFIKSGAMDQFGERLILVENIERMLSYVKEAELAKANRQPDLFSFKAVPSEKMEIPKLNIKSTGEAKRSDILPWEKEFLGLYVSEHPYNNVANRLSAEVWTIENVLNRAGNDETIRVGGVISALKKIITKKGEPMLFVSLEDSLHSLEFLVFPKLYKEKENLWLTGKLAIVEGSLSEKDGESKLLANRIWFIDEENLSVVIEELKSTPRGQGERRNYAKFAKEGEFKPRIPQGQIIIKYPKGASKDFAGMVKNLFIAIPGKKQVILKIDDKLIKTDFQIDVSREAIRKIESVFGENSTYLR